ncbi:MAG: aldo/keto reductase [Clostridiaceae bacterium]|nr:aldo/keto reductase [Clostridiaceae bacterium]
MGLDYLDLYLIHIPFGDYYGARRAMEELYHTGKVRASGVCNFDAALLMDLCWNADTRPMVNQIERHPYFQRKEELRASWPSRACSPRPGRPLPRTCTACSPILY